jgi:hypothetical protein
MTSSPAPMTPTSEPPAAYDTERDASRPTAAHHALRVAALLRLRPDPWQRHVLAVAGELEPDGTYRYPTVMLTVPRRAGKTTVAMVNSLGLVTEPAGRMRRAWYTFHRRETGAALWRDEWMPMLEASRLGAHVKCRRSNGSEAFTVRETRSVLRLFAPDGEALRSQNADTVTVDEARMFALEAGDALLAAVGPAQSRRHRRQLWIVTNAGGPDASWARKYRDAGRAGRPGLAYFEWAAPLEGEPPDAHADHCSCPPALLALANPAIAHHPEIAAAIEADRHNMPADLFHQEYHGWWDDGAATLAAIDLEAWAGAGRPDAALAPAGWSLAIDGTPDRRGGAVAAATMDDTGTVTVELVADGAGLAWTVDAGAHLARSRAGRIVLDGYGPAGNLATDFERQVGPGALEVYGTREVARACATFYDLLTTGRLTHRGQAELAAAMSGAVARKLGDGWLWDRRSTPPAVLAATLAAAAAAVPQTRPAVARAR